MKGKLKNGEYMIVSKILNFNVPQKLNSNRGNNYNCQTNYGLKMSSPLNRDTVSFGVKANTNKLGDDPSGMITVDLARKLIKPYLKNHAKLLKLINKKFIDVLSTDNKKNLITLGNRLKKNYSLREKTTSVDVEQRNFENFMLEIKDISGFEFVLEERKSFRWFCSILSEMIKNKEIKVVDMEYYRIPPLVKRGKTLETYDSLNVNLIEKLGTVVDEVEKNEKPILDIKPSKNGYSGLHITIQNEDGTFSEWQIMTRAMHNLKYVENLLYKIKNNKSVDDTYSEIGKKLSDIKPLPEYASPQEKANLKRKLTKLKTYTIDAYKQTLKHPYMDTNKFLKPSDPEIEKYDFNTLYNDMVKCKNTKTPKKRKKVE